jgi:hypothetical protein
LNALLWIFGEVLGSALMYPPLTCLISMALSLRFFRLPIAPLIFQFLPPGSPEHRTSSLDINCPGFRDSNTRTNFSVSGFTSLFYLNHRHFYGDARVSKIFISSKAIEKIKGQWSGTQNIFDVYLLNVPKLNKAEYREYGVVDPGGEIAQAIEQAIGEPMPNRPDAITILFNGNYGAEKVPMTGWIMAHRLGHAIRRSQAWENYVKEVNYVFQEILEYYYNIRNIFVRAYRDRTLGDNAIEPAPYPKGRDETQILLRLIEQLMIFKSAREKKINRYYEVYYEMLAQYLLTGNIKFSPLPMNLVIRNEPFGRKGYKQSVGEDALEELNEMLPGFAEGIEARLKAALDGAVGKTFLM